MTDQTHVMASARWQQQITARLRRDDVDALMELYDQLAPVVYGYARAIAKNRRDALGATRQAFLQIWDAPVMLCDPRVPAPIVIAALITKHIDQQSRARRAVAAAVDPKTGRNNPR